ncbi:MAG: ribosomal protein S18-alanine N-acetyltransferase [Erysipelotrichaceae bacterium]
MIRRMVEKDLPRILELEDQLFTSKWTYEQYLYELHENEFSQLYVFEIGSKIVGYLGLWLTFDIAQITTLGIDKEYQGNGYAKQLLNKLVEVANQAMCETIMLEVRVSNTRAIKLYKNFDFIEMSRRKNYYTDNNEDAIVMVKALGGNW